LTSWPPARAKYRSNAMLGYIALGGLVGTMARYGLQGWIQERLAPSVLPIGTLAVNILGSLLLGFLVRFGTGTVVMAPEVRAGLTIGFCGAFTTMSTFAYESRALFGGGAVGQALVYMLSTVVGSVLAIMAGMALANRLL
jgi:CrcB protein